VVPAHVVLGAIAMSDERGRHGLYSFDPIIAAFK
jgi:hypothetical protein